MKFFDMQAQWSAAAAEKAAARQRYLEELPKKREKTRQIIGFCAPVFLVFADAFRARFGESVRILNFEGGGHKLGRELHDGRVELTPEDWRELDRLNGCEWRVLR